MNTPTASDISNKKIIVRADLDGSNRPEIILPTLSMLLDWGASQIFLIGHKGRPTFQEEEYSLKNLVPFFSEKLTPDLEFVEYQPMSVFYQVKEKVLASKKRIIMLENLRFWQEEEKNDKQFAEELAYGWDAFVNEAFATSHRSHASIVGIPSVLPSFVGPNFAKEVEHLSKVLDNPRRPLIAIMSGVKKDKLEYLDKFKELCDKVLIAGKLPEYMHEDYSEPRVMVAKLNPDKEDITIHSIEKFEELIVTAGTIILSGPIGHFEDPGHKLGTKRVFEAVAHSNAFKVAGGGDTLEAIKSLNLEGSFDWISSGGGATLDFLANGTLPGIEAIRHK